MFKNPVIVEDAGLDIGGTLIGMHLKKVAVPTRLTLDHIGNAIILPHEPDQNSSAEVVQYMTKTICKSNYGIRLPAGFPMP